MNQDFRRKGSPLGNIFAFCKIRHILVSDSANCTVLRAVVLTQYRRVTDRRTDGQTDGIAVASTALAMRALRSAVKRSYRRRTWTVQWYLPGDASVQCAPHLIHTFWGQLPEFTTQMASRSAISSSRQSIVGHARACPFP